MARRRSRARASIRSSCSRPPPPTRSIERVARVARGYIYYVSLKGVTGATNIDTTDVEAMIARIRAHTTVPVGVGFGIRDAATARRVAGCRRRRRDRQPHRAGDRPTRPKRADRARASRRWCASSAPRSTRARWPPHELVPQAPAAQDQAREQRRRRRPSPRACGASARRARRCSTSPTSRTTCTSARSAGSTTASRARQRLDLFLDPEGRAELASEVVPDRSAQVQGQPQVHRAPRRGREGDRRDRRAGRDAGLGEERADARRGLRVRLPRRLDGLGRRRALRARACRRAATSSCRSCASPPRAARACRRGCSRSCRWPRPPRRCTSSPRRASPSSRSSPIRPWAACRRASPSSATW